MFYLPFLSSIHEKANCIAILWTVSPHSLGSCLFRGLWATCLPHKGGGIPLSALPKDTTSELAGLFSTTSHKCRAPSREAADTIFKVFWYDSTRGMIPRSTDCEADALTTTPSRRSKRHTPLRHRVYHAIAGNIMKFMGVLIWSIFMGVLIWSMKVSEAPKDQYMLCL